LETPLEGADLQLAHVSPDAPLRLELRLEAIVEGILVSGTVSGTVTVECRRCLAQTRTELAVPVSEIFVSPNDAEADDRYCLQGDDLELEPMVRDAVLLSMPLHPLCEENCKGLCATCGQDLNVADCGHRAREDQRWKPLRRLRDSIGTAEGG